MATEKRLDLVEREAIKDAIGFMNLHFLGHGENKSILDSINEVPSVDAVEVVRCEDCQKWQRHTMVDRERGHCRLYNASKHESGYCDRGERKDND